MDQNASSSSRTARLDLEVAAMVRAGRGWVVQDVGVEMGVIDIWQTCLYRKRRRRVRKGDGCVRAENIMKAGRS